MILHQDKKQFQELIIQTAKFKNIPELAIERDYYMVMMLMNLVNSKYKDTCIFKGGTSLSKCYPNTINRFSEDIDLTFLSDGLSNNKCSKEIKKIEKVIAGGFNFEPVPSERYEKSKSSYIWYDDKELKIKLEIGSNIIVNTYTKRYLKTYIQEFLEYHNGYGDIRKYNLSTIGLNVIDIERTFVDKLMAIKRHVKTNNINNKVRHIYDVYKLFGTDYIKKLLNNKLELKKIIRDVKKTDFFYFTKRKIKIQYDYNEPYDFESWKKILIQDAKKNYEQLHKTLLYTNRPQNIMDAVKVLEKINNVLKDIEE